MKPLSTNTIAELHDIFTEYEIDFPETGDKAATKKELLFALEEKGITNKTLKQWSEKAEPKEIEEPNEIITGDVVVFMNRNNPVFSWKTHTFSSTKRFIPMPKDEAFELIQAYEGFRIAGRKEIENYYR